MDDGGPAFPQVSNEQLHTSPGMSLRDHFAGQVLAGLMASTQYDAVADKADTARFCFDVADAMLAERQKGMKV